MLGQAQGVNYIFEPLSYNREPHSNSPYVDDIAEYLKLPDWYITAIDGNLQRQRIERALVPHTAWLWEQLYVEERDKTLLVKQPQTERLRWLVDIYQARAVIYMKRHPLGVLNSYIHLNAHKKNTLVLQNAMQRDIPSTFPQYAHWLTEACTDYERQALMFHNQYSVVEKVLQGIPNLVLDYEDLCFDSLEKFARFFDWLGWVWDDETEKRIQHKTHPGIERPDKNGAIQVRMPDIRKQSEKRAYGWRTELSPVAVFQVSRLYRRLKISDYPFPGTPELPYTIRDALLGWRHSLIRRLYLAKKNMIRYPKMKTDQ